MPAIDNQQTGLSYLIAINGQEITEHNRKTSMESVQSGNDIELHSGKLKRYYKKNKESFNLTFTYLPNTHEKTVDGRKGRDYLNTIAQTRGTVNLSIKLNPEESYQTYVCYVNSYSEKLVRRDIANNCEYYDITMGLEEQ